MSYQSFEDKNFLGDRLREIRMTFGFKQEDIARVLNISRATYTYYETNTTRPDPMVLGKLARYYDLPIDVFYNADWVNPFALEDSGKGRRSSRRGSQKPGILQHIGELHPDERSLILLLRSNNVFTVEDVIRSLEHQLAEHEKQQKIDVDSSKNDKTSE